jgi:hypothetical protein
MATAATRASARRISITIGRTNISMRKLLLASGLALAAVARAGLAQAQMTDPGCTSVACLQTQVNFKNPIITTNTTTTTLANQISAALQGSVLNAGTLSQTTTNTWTSATGGAGSSFNTASVTGNTLLETPTKGNVGGAVSMSNSMVGSQGILQANQNTGANAVQQNSVALTSTGNGGALSGLSPTVTGPIR